MSIFFVISLLMTGCSLLGSKTKKPPEVVASCFSDGEDQEAYCKTQRTSPEGKIVVTRCIGSKNQEAKPELRGKCVEKICSEGSNTDCMTRGEFNVLEQYAELATAKMFSSDDSAKKKKGSGGKGLKEKSLADVSPPLTPAAETVQVTPVASATPAAPEASRKVASVEKIAEKAPEPPAMNIVLRPIKKARAIASIERGFKKVCISKSESSAPEFLRGKCATRTCNSKGKCSYQGRKEMFDWVATNKDVN